MLETLAFLDPLVGCDSDNCREKTKDAVLCFNIKKEKKKEKETERQKRKIIETEYYNLHITAH